MEKSPISKSLFFTVLTTSFLSSTAAFTLIFGTTYIGWLNHLLLYIILIPLIKFSGGGNNVYRAYFYLMLIAFGCHLFVDDITIDANFKEVFRWIKIVFLLCIAQYYKSRTWLYFVLLFFIAECSVAIYERLTFTRVFPFDSEIIEGFIAAGDKDIVNFRSFSLLGHPLDNANVLSLMLGFIFISNSLSKPCKIVLLALGFCGLWAFNSRAILVWIVILAFRFLFYKGKLLYVVLSCSLFIVVWPYIAEWLNSGALGRFSLDFTDDSSATRLDSFVYFWFQPWDVESVLFGGKLIYTPMTDLLLENGLLLNMAWWGWITGVAKLVLEVFITYKVLYLYNMKEKFILLLSVWGVAMANNNAFNPKVLTFFLIAYTAFYVNDMKRLQNNITK